MFSVFGPFGVVLMHSGPLVGECFLEKYDKISFNFLVELFFYTIGLLTSLKELDIAKRGLLNGFGKNDFTIVVSSIFFVSCLLFWQKKLVNCFVLQNIFYFF